MQFFEESFKGKKITVMGLGLLGRGVGDVEFLASNGASLIVTDLKNEEELRPSLDKLKKFENITYTLGEHRREDFKGRDFVLKGPTVPFDSQYIETAKKEGTSIKMSASWFAELADIPVVGITGTRGKTTTTYMLYNMMKNAGMHVLLGGNVRGVSTLALLPEVKKDSIALMELDSWQCSGFGDAEISPNVSVFTSFMKDHMDYYRNDEAMYLDAKAQIFLHQDAQDSLILAPNVVPVIEEKYGQKIKSNLVIADTEKGQEGWMTPPIPGTHNVQNARCAVEAARVLGIDDGIIKNSLSTFKAVSGRLELVRELHGIKIYNDTTATTPEATIAALDALKSSSTVLIMGGNSKGLDTNVLVHNAKTLAKKTFLLKGTGTDEIKSKLSNSKVYDDLETAVKDAIKSAEKNDVILFSPAFTSFGMFQNEFDRGDQFISIINSL